MQCVRCGRPLIHVCASIETKFGPLVMGPVCARKAGLIKEPERVNFVKPEDQPIEHDPRQIGLDL